MRKRKKIQLATGRGLVKVEEPEVPMNKGGKVLEKDLAKALRLTVGNQSQAALLLDGRITQPSISRRIKKSKHLQQVVDGTREVFLDDGEYVVKKLFSKLKKAIDSNNWTAECTDLAKTLLPLILKYLGNRRGWQAIDNLNVGIQGNIQHGVMIVPQTMDPKDWEAHAKRQQIELLGEDEPEESEEEEEAVELSEEEELELEQAEASAAEMAQNFDPEAPARELSDTERRRAIHEGRIAERVGHSTKVQGL